jgi:hypothetical protein
VPDSTEIIDLLLQGESESLEFKTALSEPATLARLIASFANAKGGKILVGVKEPPEVVGVDEPQLRRVYDAATKLLSPPAQSSLIFVVERGLSVGIVDVAASQELVLAEGSAFLRTGSMTQPMAWTKMRDRLPPKPAIVNLETLMKASEQQTVLLEKLSADNEQMKSELTIANDPAAKWKERFIGFGLGVAASIVAALILLVAAKQWAWLK